MGDRALEIKKYRMEIKTQTVTVLTNKWLASLFLLIYGAIVNLFPHEPTKGQLVEVVADDQALHQLADMALHIKVILQEGRVATCEHKASKCSFLNGLKLNIKAFCHEQVCELSI